MKNYTNSRQQNAGKQPVFQTLHNTLRNNPNVNPGKETKIKTP